MTRTSEHHPISHLNPISDRDAAAAVRAETLAALAAAVMDIPVPARRRVRQIPAARLRRPPTVKLALAAAVAAVALVGVTGAISGHAPTVAQPADAQILRGAEAALRPAGAIVVESVRDVMTCRTYACRRTSATSGGRVQSVSLIRATSGGAMGEEVVLHERGVDRGVELAVVGSGAQLYDPARNTVYAFSAYGHDLHPGPSPETYVYRLPAQQTLLREGAMASQWPVAPASGSLPALTLTVTAAQARALLSGTARIDIDTTPTGTYALRVAQAQRTPDLSPTAQARLWLGSLRVVGPTVVDGRSAIKLVPARGVGEYDVAPGSYDPIRQIRVTRDATFTTTWSQYRVLRDTPRNHALLDLIARHPGARVVDDNAAYTAAWHRLIYGD